MTNSKKINNGCINIFRFIQLLYDNEAYYDRVVAIYKNEIGSQSVNNLQVVLNKAVNSLKVFGIKVHKEKNKYQLNSSFYTAEYSLDDLKSISLIIKAIENFPNKKVKLAVEEMIKLLILRMSEDCKKKLNSLCSNYQFNFLYKSFKKQIEDCSNLCKSELMFNVKYNNKGEEIQRTGVAKDVIYTAKTAYLLMYDTDSRLNYQIPIPSILSIDPLSSKTKKMVGTQNVSYYLLGRLAHTYKPKENESVYATDLPDKIEVISKSEPINVLLPRLMRYQDKCIIKSPKYVKKLMLDLINETLVQYETD